MTRRRKLAQTRGLWLRGRVWWMAETLPGVGRVRISLQTQDLAEALQKAATFRAEPWKAARKTTATSVPGDRVSEWLASLESRGISRSWREHGGYSVRMALREMGGPVPEAVSPALLRRWLDDTRARTNDSTARAYFRRVADFFAWMVRTNRIRVSPAAGIQPPRSTPHLRRNFLKPEEARRLLDECCDKELKFCLLCALQAGLRKAEIIASRPEWFDLKAGLLHVQNTPDFTVKDRDARTIPLTEEFTAFLQDYGLRGPYMLAPDAKPGRARYRFDFQRRWDSHLKACGIEGITFHDLRRTFASLLVSSGVSLYKVARWLGDGIEVVEKRYAHLVAQDDDINRAWSAK